MGLGIQEKRVVSPGSPAKTAPESAAVARAEGAPDCAPTTPVDQAIFDVQVGNARGVTLNGVYKYPSNEVLEADKKAITKRREELALAVRPYEPSITLDTSSQGFNWKTAVAGGEMSELAYADEKTVRSQLGTWGFDDVLWVDKKTPLHSVKDIFRARDVQAFVGASKDAIAVSFRGTERNSLRDILTDMAALFPSDMKAKAFPVGMTPAAKASFDEKLLGAMGKRLGQDFVDQAKRMDTRLTPEQITKIVAALPDATAEALGDASGAKVIEDAIHRGFKQSKDMVAPELLTKILTLWEDDIINKKALRPVFLFGHSMGGAEATLFGYDLLATTEQMGSLARAAGLKNMADLVKPGFKLPFGGVYTYEAPHSFKRKAADEIVKLDLGFQPEDLIHNFARMGDPVPNLPTFGSYTNLGNTIYLNGTLGRLANCPDPRATALVNPSGAELKALKAKRAHEWLDTTAPSDINAHLLGEIRDLVKAQAALAQ